MTPKSGRVACSRHPPSRALWGLRSWAVEARGPGEDGGEAQPELDCMSWRASSLVVLWTLQRFAAAFNCSTKNWLLQRPMIYFGSRLNKVLKGVL